MAGFAARAWSYPRTMGKRRISAADVGLKPSRKSRYGKPKKKIIGPDGRKYDSKREMLRGQDLLMLERAGRIRGLEFQFRFKITIGGVKVLYPSGRHMAYVADFVYFDVDKREKIIEDVKMQSGFLTETYPIKRALMLAMGLTITEV